MTLRDFNETVANFSTFFLILCILYFSLAPLPQNMLFRGSGNLNRVRELFELKSFCVFIAEEAIKIPILFSPANSMAEGNEFDSMLPSRLYIQ